MNITDNNTVHHYYYQVITALHYNFYQFMQALCNDCPTTITTYQWIDRLHHRKYPPTQTIAIIKRVQRLYNLSRRKT